MIKVVLTKIPLRYYFYYHWLILGFYELEKKGKIKFEIKPKLLIDRILLRNYKIFLGLRKYLKQYSIKIEANYLMEGFIEIKGRKQLFCYDIADTPYYFVTEELEKNVIYFKAQCPKKIETIGFELTPEVRVPYHPVVLKNKHKIFPSMLGPGGRTHNIYSYESLLNSYKSLFINKLIKTDTLMCYFGGNKGPKAEFSYHPDIYLNESHILGFWGDFINHPNEKRAIAARLISEKGKGYDGRIIKIYNKYSEDPKLNKDLFIPLEEYIKHISRFKYNLNISGFRKSIPNRFIYSFCVGTAIVTDKLSVKWYRPFEDEVFEINEMGYLPNNQVNWGDFNNSMDNLPEISEKIVLENFEKKWSPKAFANYVVQTCIKKL